MRYGRAVRETRNGGEERRRVTRPLGIELTRRGAVGADGSRARELRDGGVDAAELALRGGSEVGVEGGSDDEGVPNAILGLPWTTTAGGSGGAVVVLLVLLCAVETSC
jgi:hypothetical protein